jgi:hypothetical protein
MVSPSVVAVSAPEQARLSPLTPPPTYASDALLPWQRGIDSP